MIIVDNGNCELCGTCSGVCQSDAIYIEKKSVIVDEKSCINCKACISVCPVAAITENK
jgi:MinD superfamily P-loop ATPase